MNYAFEAMTWIIVAIFGTTAIITLLGMMKKISIKQSYLNKLFVALILEIVAAGFLIFQRGLSPEQEYFRQAKALFEEARAARADKKFELAERKLGEILQLSVRNLPFEVRSVFKERGELWVERRNWPGAAQSLSVYYEIHPNDLDALIGYGRALREIGRYSTALSIYEAAQRLSPNQYDVLNGLQNINRRLGSFYVDADRVDVAEIHFNQARSQIAQMLSLIDGKNDQVRQHQAHLAAARLYWQWRRYDEAIASYDALLKQFPSFPQSSEDLAAILIEAGEAKNDQSLIVRARNLYLSLNENPPANSNPIFSGAGLAEASALAENTSNELLAKARTAVLQSLAHSELKEDPYAFYAAAVLFKRLKETEQAKKYLAEAIRHEKQRAKDLYQFDFVRLVKYEKLAERWANER